MTNGFKKFSKDKSGNLSIFLALGLIPTLTLITGAFEYSQFTKIHANVQNAADNAVLAAFHNPDEEWNDRVQRINRLFEANLIHKSRMEFAKARLEANVVDKKTVMTYTVSSGLKTFLGGLSPFSMEKFRTESRAIFDPKSGRPPRLAPLSWSAGSSKPLGT